MRILTLIFCVLCLLACSSTPQVVTHQPYVELNLPLPLHTPGLEIPDRDQLFELPESAKVLLDEKFKRYRRDPLALIKEFEIWMAKPGGFRVLYDNETTQLASETYESGAGNCMSLALLTAAFSKHLNLHFDFMRPDVPLYWEQREDIETINDHINVMVRANRGSLYRANQQAFLVDFSVLSRFRYASERIISEAEAISLFYRNRAAEALAKGELDLAYSYGYQVMEIMPMHAGSYSLMGVILRRQGQQELAEQVYLAGMQFDQGHPFLLHNLVYMYRFQGEEQKAQPYLAQLERLKLKSPFVIAREADELYEQGKYEEALALYRKAIRKADYIHDFHFGKARSLFSLGNYKAARRALTKAKELSTTLRQGYVYENKLSALESYL